MEITFLGTASNNPSPVRGVSCTVFRFEGDVWMFDCGEGSQIQLMKSSVKPGKITKIFITHLHGDHIFGLCGLMCTIGQNIQPDKKPLVEIYGPVGLRRYVRTSLELSRSFVTYDYMVHEMIPIDDQIPEEIKNWKIIENDDSILHPSEKLGSQISINTEGYWHLFENELVSIKSSWIKHRIPTFGFVIEQKPLPGRLDVDALKAHGITPGPIFKKIKAGENVKMEDGKIIEAKNFVGESRPGKKITILGDCYECSNSMIELGRNSNVLVHEATLENEFKSKAISNGHSTPSMASDVGNRMNAKCLILNHFSQRYKPVNYVKDEKLLDKNAGEDEEDDNVQKLVDEAKIDFKENVLASFDLFTYKV